MAIVGGFLGGPGTTIPTGYHSLDLKWITTDGQNLDASVQLTGPETRTVQLDSNGQATVVVMAGTYLMHVIHEGQYQGDEDKTVTLGSRESSTQIWVGVRIYPQTVIFQSPTSLDSASYKITNAITQEVVEQNTGWSSTTVFSLYPGDYVLELTYAGVTAIKSFSFGNSSTTFDTSDMFCKVTISSTLGMPTSVTYNGSTMDLSNGSFYVLRTTESKTVSMSGGIPKYGGISESEIASWNNSNLVASSANVTLTLSSTGRTVLITEGGTLQVPVSGTFNIACIGGGGGSGKALGGSAAGGGGGGYVTFGDYELNVAGYEITIGGGAVDGSIGNGGPTSFGTVLSASGGNAGNGIHGGDGGSGGGGAGHPEDINRGRGGNGAFGGGGGTGRPSLNGSGGTYGGDGGVNGGSGSSGRSASGRNDVFKNSNPYSGGSGGGVVSRPRYSGSGGGGGLGARGGSGGGTNSSSNTTERAGGSGGGGGIAGGDGGKGGYASTSSRNNGNAGKGYGAGAGGPSAQDSLGVYRYSGGGGGGGYGSKSNSYASAGCVLIMWRG